MSAVPPSCFDWPRGSGYPINYGSSTILTDAPIRTYAPASRIITLVGGSGAPGTGPSGVPGYFQFLDTRFDTPPSGWNQIGQPSNYRA